MLSRLVQAGIALTRKRPSHKLMGIGRFTSVVISEMNCNRGMAFRGTFESQSLQRSNLELLAFAFLPEPTGQLPRKIPCNPLLR
jgi:hypothetical protein